MARQRSSCEPGKGPEVGGLPLIRAVALMCCYFTKEKEKFSENHMSCAEGRAEEVMKGYCGQ